MTRHETARLRYNEHTEVHSNTMHSLSSSSSSLLISSEPVFLVKGIDDLSSRRDDLHGAGRVGVAAEGDGVVADG